MPYDHGTGSPYPPRVLLENCIRTELLGVMRVGLKRSLGQALLMPFNNRVKAHVKSIRKGRGDTRLKRNILPKFALKPTPDTTRIPWLPLTRRNGGDD
jgi:hypothetical protein